MTRSFKVPISSPSIIKDGGTSAQYLMADGSVSSGATGTQGVQGFSGAQGTSGTNGLQGSTGTQGLAGAQGLTGTQGSIGSPGAMNYAQTIGIRQTNISTAGTTIVSVVITTSGSPIQVLVSGDVENNGAGGWTQLQLYRGGTAIGNIVHTEGSAGSENSPYAITVIDTPSAGTYTYSLRLNNAAGGSFNFGESNGPVITVIELTGATGPSGIQGTTGLQGLIGSGIQGVQGIQGVSSGGGPTDDDQNILANQVFG